MKDKNAESSVTKLELDVEKILKAIAKLKPDKSQGPDELSPKLWLLVKCGSAGTKTGKVRENMRDFSRIIPVNRSS